MKPNTEVKENIIAYTCTKPSVSDINGGFVANASVTSISNEFIEVSRTDRKVTFIGFDHDISKEIIPNGYAMNELT